MEDYLGFLYLICGIGCFVIYRLLKKRWNINNNSKKNLFKLLFNNMKNNKEIMCLIFNKTINNGKLNAR